MLLSDCWQIGALGCVPGRNYHVKRSWTRGLLWAGVCSTVLTIRVVGWGDASEVAGGCLSLGAAREDGPWKHGLGWMEVPVESAAVRGRVFTWTFTYVVGGCSSIHYDG